MNLSSIFEVTVYDDGVEVGTFDMYLADTETECYEFFNVDTECLTATANVTYK